MSSSVLGRLSKLGSLPTRRRVANPTDIENEEDYVPDISDIASTQDNLPTPTAEGGIDPQSYDPRANRVITPESEAGGENNLHRRIGETIGRIANEEAGAEAPMAAPEEEPVPPSNIPGTQQEPGFWSKLGSSLNNALLNSGGLVGQGVKNLFQEVNEAKSPQGKAQIAENLLKMEDQYPNLKEAYVPEFLGGKGSIAEPYAAQHAPELLQERQQNAAQKQADLRTQVVNRMENPWTGAAYGASDEISKSPELQAQIQEIAGINWEPQIAAQVKQYEAAMQEIDTGLREAGTAMNEQINAIRNRIENNQATDQDKWFIGLSLLLPLVLGGFFGAEVGLASLGGAAQGLANAKTAQQKQVGVDQEALNDLFKLRSANEAERGQLQLKKAALPQELRKSLPEDEFAHIRGLNEAKWVDPVTGKEESGLEIRPGFVAPINAARNQKALELLEKRADKLVEKKGYIDKINNVTDDMVEILSKIKDKNFFMKFLAAHANGTIPGFLAKFTDDIEWDGRKVNAGPLLEQKYGYLANAYGEAQKLGQLDAAAQRHFDRVFLNPTKSLHSADDAITQLLEGRKATQRDLIDSTRNAGFKPQLIQSELGSKNRGIYNRLNVKQDDKDLEDITKKLSK